MSSDLYIGLISGTSRDGLDAALVDFEEGRPDLLHASCTPYPPAIREELDALLQTGSRPQAHSLRLLDRQLGHFFARACRALLEESGLKPRDVRAIGSHGQTVWHEPDGDRPVSLQLGNGFVIANVTGVTTVNDFRTADIAAGGQGAPLAPLLHRQLFHDADSTRAILNLGGIANLTWLEPGGAVSGFDTGPANCLIDLWTQQHLDQEFDRHGEWASGGQLNPELLERFLDEPYFDLPPPKSTGLELFNGSWLKEKLEGADVPPEDVQRTLVQLTVQTISPELESRGAGQVLVCGGGVHNDFLMDCLREAALADNPAMEIESTADHGVHPDWVEACLFAWLARERLQQRPQDTTTITGARQPVMLGEIHEP